MNNGVVYIDICSRSNASGKNSESAARDVVVEEDLAAVANPFHVSLSHAMTIIDHPVPSRLLLAIIV